MTTKTGDKPCGAAPKDSATGSKQDDLATLSAPEYGDFDRMADMMSLFHNSFRQTWQSLLAAVSEPKPQTSPSATHMTARAIITQTLTFLHHLHIHHSIEEAHIFPHLATRMPAFRPDAPALQQHKQIHAGMDQLQKYMIECKTGERSLRREEVRELMQGWGGVLWRHLDEEVESLGAQQMRRYWTRGEMCEMPM